MVARWIIWQSAPGRLAPRLGNRHPVFVPQGCFACAGDDGWIAISVTANAAWQALCHVIQRADLAADGGLVTAAGRRARETEIEAAIAAWTRQRSSDLAMAALQAAGIAAGAVRSPFELQVEPHLAARRFWQEVERPFSGPHAQPLSPYREDGEPYPARRAAPTLGQDNEFVLGELLGLSAQEMA